MMANVGIAMAVRHFLFGDMGRNGRTKDQLAMPMRGGNAAEYVTAFPGSSDAWRLLR